MPYPPTAGGPQSLVDSAVAHATKIPAPRIAAHVRSLRRRNPNASRNGLLRFWAVNSTPSLRPRVVR